MNLTRSLLLIALTALSTGCATGRTKYQCPTDTGAACMGMVEMYEATNNSDRVIGRGDDERGRSRDDRGDRDVRVAGDDLQFAAPAAPAVYLPTQLPVRAPAKVMRIWVAPWVDDSGDLHLAGHLFTEIEGRKWSVGDDGVDTVPVLFQPLQVGATAAPAAQP